MTHFNQANYQHDLTSLNLNDYPQLSTNEMTQLFHKKIMNAYNKHAPLKHLSKPPSKTKQKPWLTKGILISIKVKQHLFKMYKIQDKLYRDSINYVNKTLYRMLIIL